METFLRYIITSVILCSVNCAPHSSREPTHSIRNIVDGLKDILNTKTHAVTSSSEADEKYHIFPNKFINDKLEEDLSLSNEKLSQLIKERLENARYLTDSKLFQSNNQKNILGENKETSIISQADEHGDEIETKRTSDYGLGGYRFGKRGGPANYFYGGGRFGRDVSNVMDFDHVDPDTEDLLD